MQFPPLCEMFLCRNWRRGAFSRVARNVDLAMPFPLTPLLLGTTMPPAVPLLADYNEQWQQWMAPHPLPPHPPPASPDRCQDWCDPNWPKQHCADVKCEQCGFCLARSGCLGDWCSAALAEAHCEKPECVPCSFCARSSMEFSAAGG